MILTPEFVPSGYGEANLLSAQLAEEARTEAPIDAVFSAPFLLTHAAAPDLATLFQRAGLPPSGGIVDRFLLEAIGEATLDRIVEEHTDFGSWREFRDAAERAYVARKILEFTL